MPQVHSVSFVKLRDLPGSDWFWLLDWGNLTWGTSAHTLISQDAFLTALAGRNAPTELFDAIAQLLSDCYIDLEN